MYALTSPIWKSNAKQAQSDATLKIYNVPKQHLQVDNKFLPMVSLTDNILLIKSGGGNGPAKPQQPPRAGGAGANSGQSSDCKIRDNGGIGRSQSPLPCGRGYIFALSRRVRYSGGKEHTNYYG